MFLIMGLVLLTAVPAPGDPPPATRPVCYATRTMGTYANVSIMTSDSVRSFPLAQIAHQVFRRVDSLMTNWTETSEVARLNLEAGRGPARVEPEVARVLDEALRVWRESEGAEDVTVEPLVRLWGFLGGPKRVPGDAEIAAARRHVGSQLLRFDPVARTLTFVDPEVRIDLGGIAKGYAVDVVAESLAAHGVRDALVDLTGNMRALGSPASGRPWRIGIRDPRDRVPSFARLELHDEAISTSGQYEQFVAANGRRYGHIMDPRSGWPAQGLLSVTVVARRGLTTDAWDTPLFVLGAREAMRIARARDDIAAVIVQPGIGVDTVWVEEALRSRFVLAEEARAWFHVAYF